MQELVCFSRNYLMLNSPLQVLYYLQPPFLSIYDRKNKVAPFDASIKAIDLPIPKATSAVSLEAATQARMQELLRMKMPMAIHYSGGIDSSYVLCEFLKAGIKPLVLTTIGALNENQKMAKQIQEKQLKCEIAFHWDPQYLHIFGDGAEQIFGSDSWDLLQNYFGLDFLQQEPTLSNMKSCIAKLCYIEQSESIVTEIAQYYLDVRHSSPIPIKTLQGLFWWYNFNCLWHSAEFGKYLWVEQPRKYKIKSFFCSDEFQKYSLLYHLNENPEYITDYKKPLKQVVAEFTQDPEFLLRSKSPSSQYAQSFLKMNSAVTSQMEALP